METTSRRNFLKSTLVAGVGLSMPENLISAAPFAKIRGANDDIRVAVVGMFNKGKQHIKYFHEIPGVRVTALCDVDTEVLDKEAKLFADRNEKVKKYKDFRQVLDDKNIDAVVLVTPDHWHAIQLIWACEAGKDVYVEKPLSHNIWEGEQMIKAVQKYKRIVQVGMQRRSDPGMKEIVEYLREGNLGKIKVARCICYIKRESLGQIIGPQPIPETVDYDMWTGPAPMEPLNRKNLHYDWRFFWNVGSGDLPNNGIHFFDLCRWVTAQDDVNVPLVSVAGRYAWNDCGETPNTHIAYWDFKPAPIILELRNLPRKTGDSASDHYKGVRAGIVIECEDGYIAGSFAYDDNGKKIKQFHLDNGAGHQSNFIESVRSRNPKDLNADILEGHRSTVLCQLANISHRAGEMTSIGEIEKSIQKSNIASEAFSKYIEHLKANEIDISETCATLGPWINYNPKRKIIETSGTNSNLIANSLLTRQYRKPYVLPQV